MPTSALLFTESHSVSASIYPLPGKDKSTIRHLFSAPDLDAITRNAEEILEFHEGLVRELRAVVSPFGFSMSLEGQPNRDVGAQPHANGLAGSYDDMRAAVNAVSAIFTEHVSSSDRCASLVP